MALPARPSGTLRGGGRGTDPDGGEPVVAGSAPAPAPAIRRPRERSPLGWITFGVALLIVSVAAIWTSLADDTLATARQAAGLERISTIPAIGLLVLAAGLLVGSVFGRARWLDPARSARRAGDAGHERDRLPFEGTFGDSFVRPADLAGDEIVTRRSAFGASTWTSDDSGTGPTSNASSSSAPRPAP